MKRKIGSVKKRNPVAKAVKKIRPKVVPDTRRKKLAAVKQKELREEVE